MGLAPVAEAEATADGLLHRLRSLNSDQTRQERHPRIGIYDCSMLPVKLCTCE